MCTVNGPDEIMVCDSSRDAVKETLLRRLGAGVRVETVHYEGTRFTCRDADRLPEFQTGVREALASLGEQMPAFPPVEGGA